MVAMAPEMGVKMALDMDEARRQQQWKMHLSKSTKDDPQDSNAE